MDGCRNKVPFKRPMYTFSFAATYPGLWQRQGQSGVETPEERLGTEALGRELRELLSDPVLRHPPYGSSIMLSQTTHLQEAEA